MLAGTSRARSLLSTHARWGLIGLILLAAAVLQWKSVHFRQSRLLSHDGSTALQSESDALCSFALRIDSRSFASTGMHFQASAPGHHLEKKTSEIFGFGNSGQNRVIRRLLETS